MSYCIGDIFLGRNEGALEALEDNFENYFYDYGDIINKTLAPNTYFVLGRKGTGKTLLGEYIHKTKTISGSSNAKLVPFRDFQFHLIDDPSLKTTDVSPNEYIGIWTWILLIEMAKVILDNKSLKENTIYERLNNFISTGYKDLLLSQPNPERDLKNLNYVQGSYLKTESAISREGSYKEFILDLQNCIDEILELKSDHNYILVLDGIDDRFTNSSIYKDGLISLIKVVQKLNLRFRKKRFNAKIILLIRTDIFAILNDTDLNKWKVDNSFCIDWVQGGNTTFNSPLFDLIFKKIRCSPKPELNKLHEQQLITKLFEETVKRQTGYYFSTDRFLLERTFFRPRDLITYLNFVREVAPREQRFTSKGILSVERRYSEYFYDEIKNELKGHITDEVIEEITALIKNQSKSRFSYEDIKQFERQRKGNLNKISLEKALQLMFDFSIIGNLWENDKGISRSTWKFRDNLATIDFGKMFVIHWGLYKVFQA